MTEPLPPLGFAVRHICVPICGREFTIEALLDTQQFADPTGAAERLGISPSLWPIFGQLWPAAIVLAEALAQRPLAGVRMLDVGCGLGLASVVARSRGADVTASDIHPLSAHFLARNAAHNGLPPIPFRRGAWRDPDPALGRFPLLVASDVLYEPSQSELLAQFLERHAEPTAEILVVDPGRGQQNRFARRMQELGFDYRFVQSPVRDTVSGRFTGKLHTLTRRA